MRRTITSGSTARATFAGLTGDQLTPAAKVLAVADVADALMSERPYRDSQ